MSWVAAAVVAGASVVGSVAAANSQSKAIKSAASSEAAAAEANIRANEEERARNEALFAPAIASGDKAQAYADALTYGSGTYGGAPAAPQTYAGGGAYDWNAYLQAYPDVAAEAQRMVGLGRFPNVQAYAQNHYETFGSSGGHQPITNAQSHAAQTPAQTVSRADVEQLVRDSTPYQLAQQGFDAEQQTYNAANFYEWLGNKDALDRELGLYGDERDDLTGIENDGYARDRASYGAERETSRTRNTEQRDTGLNLASTSRADRESVADNARTAYRGVGDENYGNTKSILDASYATRQGLTDAATAAWEAKALEQLQKNQDIIASRFGIRGDVGRSESNLATVGEDYARDRAIYEAQRRLEDFNTYDTGLLGADAQRGGTYLDAENAYGNDMRRAADVYASDLGRVNDTYYGNEGIADTRYYDQNNARSGVNTANIANFAQNYYSQVGDAYGRNTNAETNRLRYYADAAARNQANLTAGKQASYSDFLAGLQGRTDAGDSARRSIASYGQAATAANNQQRSYAADAASTAASARGAVQQQLYGDLAGIAGSAYGAITNNNNTSSKKSYYYA